MQNFVPQIITTLVAGLAVSAWQGLPAAAEHSAPGKILTNSASNKTPALNATATPEQSTSHLHDGIYASDCNQGQYDLIELTGNRLKVTYYQLSDRQCLSPQLQGEPRSDDYMLRETLTTPDGENRLIFRNANYVNRSDAGLSVKEGVLSFGEMGTQGRIINLRNYAIVQKGVFPFGKVKEACPDYSGVWVFPELYRFTIVINQKACWFLNYQYAESSYAGVFGFNLVLDGKERNDFGDHFWRAGFEGDTLVVKKSRGSMNASESSTPDFRHRLTDKPCGLQLEEAQLEVLGVDGSCRVGYRFRH